MATWDLLSDWITEQQLPSWKRFFQVLWVTQDSSTFKQKLCQWFIILKRSNLVGYQSMQDSFGCKSEKQNSIVYSVKTVTICLQYRANEKILSAFVVLLCSFFVLKSFRMRYMTFFIPMPSDESVMLEKVWIISIGAFLYWYNHLTTFLSVGSYSSLHWSPWVIFILSRLQAIPVSLLCRTTREDLQLAAGCWTAWMRDWHVHVS